MPTPPAAHNHTRRPGPRGALSLLLCLCLLAAAGCGPDKGPYAGRTAVPLPKPSDTRQSIDESNLLHLWPLTVDHGTIECRDRQYALFIAPDGTEYGLNEVATRKGYPSIEKIHRAKVSLGALRSHTLALCTPNS